MKLEIQKRTKGIGLQVIRLVNGFPNKPVCWILEKQILRSSMSVGANYRSACRAKSKADMVNKLRIVEEEADETQYWLEIAEEIKLLDGKNIESLKKEIDEIISITVASIRTLESKM